MGHPLEIREALRLHRVVVTRSGMLRGPAHRSEAPSGGDGE